MTPMTDVSISQKDESIIATAGGQQIASAPIKDDASALFKKAIDTVPDGGSLSIGKGLYVLSAPYAFPLNPDGSNIFHCSIRIIDKSMHIYGAGVGKTIIRLAPKQRDPSRHVALMLIRGETTFSSGYDGFTLSGITFDGARDQQDLSSKPHDGEALVLAGSQRRNGKYLNLEFKNSHGSGMYLGNNGSGFGEDELVQNVAARNCRAEGIMLDTNQRSQVLDCEAWGCREGLTLHGNGDWESRSRDQVSATGFKTDSQVTVWQINDFTLSGINMDCSPSTGAYGLLVRDGKGQVKSSILKNDKAKANSTGGATNIYESAQVLFNDCQLEGFFGIHAMGRSRVEAKNCRLAAPGGCYCTTDLDPVQSTIIADNCVWSGKKVAMQDGATFVER